MIAIYTYICKSCILKKRITIQRNLFTRIWYNKPLLTLLSTCRIYRICGNSLRDGKYILCYHTLSAWMVCLPITFIGFLKIRLTRNLKKPKLPFFTITLNCAQAKQYGIGKTFYIINAWATILNFLHRNCSSSLMFHN